MNGSGARVPRLLRQLARYTLTAGGAAVVDLGGFAALIFLDLPVALSAATSFLAATVVNYFLTARFVFGVSPSLSLYPRFLAAASAGFAFNVGVTMAAHAFGLSPVLSKLTGIGVAFLANFAMNSAWVFTSRPE